MTTTISLRQVTSLGMGNSEVCIKVSVKIETVVTTYLETDGCIYIAIPFGPPGAETLVLNLDSLWYGGPFEFSVNAVFVNVFNRSIYLRCIELFWWQPDGACISIFTRHTAVDISEWHRQ